MRVLLEKMKNISESVIAIVTATSVIIGVLLAIYNGIYRLNQTVTSVVKAIPLLEEHNRFLEITVDYDIYLAESQLNEKGGIDMLLMRKLVQYESELALTSEQLNNIKYLKSKSKYYQ
ncbi:hypothetical protein [Fusobacterium perfoetens]|uniref:hypothetical protein n=1 Tax=Fusobacterium perfoetens TaxID=852 RepID=UPI001F31FEB7|nr:hypothetical protein [Fusobacterium perfoetens]MCF2611655.1 hypothetical protein [Fusobacterium perfoetens]